MSAAEVKMPDIIVALDFQEPDTAVKFAEILDPGKVWVKVGLELFTRAGPDIIARLKSMDFRIFLDLKLMDIPNTVRGAVLACLDMEVDMLTLHLMGGKSMIQAALAARQGSKNPAARFIGVTLLTSLDSTDLPWPESRPVAEVTLDLAGKGRSWGLDGCVCSGLEAGLIRKMAGPDFLLVTPGIRINPGSDDQKRTVTPEQASNCGADYLVIGRPITRSSDPAKTIDDILSKVVYQ